jgi:hypothetical protein
MEVAAMKTEGCVAREWSEGVEVEGVAADASSTNDDGEFKLTIRKLELPVRPRGVLAE